MTKRDITSFTCKIVAVLFFMDAAGRLFFTIPQIIASSRASGPIYTLALVSNIRALISELLVIAICVLLWFQAENIAARFTDESSPQDSLLIDDSLAPSILAMVGIVLFTLAISPLLRGVSQVYMLSTLKKFGDSPHYVNLLSVGVFQMAIGIGLFFGANGISQKLRKQVSSEGLSIKVLLHLKR